MKFSIIILYYNDGYKNGFLQKVIWGLNRQTFTDFEVIIVDNNSPVPLTLVGNENSNIKIIRLECNKGQCTARNVGLREAGGERVIFNDGDGVYSSNFLEVHSEANTDVFMTLRDGRFKKQLNCKLEQVEEKVNEWEDKDLEVLCETLHHPDINHFLNSAPNATSFKREVILQENYDENFNYCKDSSKGRGWEDTELGVRLYKKGYSFSGSKEAFTMHIEHPCAIKIEELMYSGNINWNKLLEKHPDLEKICSSEWYNLPRGYRKIPSKHRPTIGIYGINRYIGGTETSLIELTQFIRTELIDFNVWIAQMDGYEDSKLDFLLEDYKIAKVKNDKVVQHLKNTDILIYYVGLTGLKIKELANVKYRIKMFGGKAYSMLSTVGLIPTHYWAKSQEISGWLVENVNPPVENMFIAQTPINIDYWNKYDKDYVSKFRSMNKIKDDQVIVGTIARNEKLKETITLLKSFSFPNVKVLVVGTKEKIPGCLTLEQLPSRHLYQLMDIFLYYSKADGVPRVLMEAMCNSLPIISSDIGGISTLGHQYIIDNDFSEFRSKVKILSESKELRLKIGKNNYNAITNYNEQMKQKISNFLRSLV